MQFSWDMSISDVVNLLLIAALVYATIYYARKTRDIAAATKEQAQATREQAEASVRMAEEMQWVRRKPHLDDMFELGEGVRTAGVLDRPAGFLERILQTSADTWSQPSQQLEFQLGPEGDPAYPCLQSHLKGNDCWKHLETVRQQLLDYENECRKLGKFVEKGAGTSVEDAHKGLWSSWDTSMKSKFVISIVRGAWTPPVFGSPTSDLSYQHSPGYASLIIYGYSFSVVTDNDAVRLESFHRGLCTRLSTANEIRRLYELYQKVEQAQKALSDGLQPDDRLRKLIMEGHCDYCP